MRKPHNGKKNPVSKHFSDGGKKKLHFLSLHVLQTDYTQVYQKDVSVMITAIHKENWLENKDLKCSYA